MKGTLFSADFIEDRQGNLRLLEINTDTGIITQGLPYIDFNPVLNIINTSGINEVFVISKKIHEDLVTLFSSSLSASGSVSSFTNIVEEDSTIYPTAVEDLESRFILRMAYDESAIFDSTYAKDKSALLKLFAQANETGSIQEFYISGSGVMFDLLPEYINSSSIPDVVVKDITDTTTSPLEFYKLGQSTLPIGERFSGLKSSFPEDTLISSFYDNPSLSKVESIRSYNIIYGPSLDILDLGSYRVEALFTKPSSNLLIDDSTFSNKVNQKHYYELTTSHPKFTTAYSWNGIFEEESIVKADNSTVRISDALIGDRFKSYFISGSPDSDVVSIFSNWFFSGSELPSGSYPTSSVLINNIEQPLIYNLIHHVELADSSSFRASAAAHVLIYDSERDGLRYEIVGELKPSVHSLVNVSGSNIPVASLTCEVLDGSYSSHIIDMESTDTFFLSDSQLNIKIVTHNCFPAGTRITLADGSQKNIEDLTLEDKLLTWNEQTKEVSEGSIGNIITKNEKLLIKLTTSIGEVKSTPLHKFYVSEKGWTSAQDIKIGDILINESNSEVSVTEREDLLGDFKVYHIVNVQKNHTYFAENLLVHNSKFVFVCFPAGTKVTLGDLSVKNIEELTPGEEVLSFNETTKVQEVNKIVAIDTHIHNDLVKFILANGQTLTCTFEHPIYVNDFKLGSFMPEWTQAKYDFEHTIEKIKIGDQIHLQTGELVSIEKIEVLRPDSTQTFIIRVENNHNFYADSILVHNK